MELDLFKLSLDERVHDPAVPVGVFAEITKEMLTEEGCHALHEVSLQFAIQDAGRVQYPDYLEHPLPLLSTRLKLLVEKFCPRMKFFAVRLLDLRRKHSQTYWLMIPPRVGCLSAESEFRPDGALRRLVVEGEQLNSWMLFQVAGIAETQILVHLALAESLLRRDFDGIRLTRVERAGTGSSEAAYGS
ncbi:serine protease [Paenibacillus woosongensis]|uniref:Serine protease n=1 Tax=Paenibacillus woosongensis TaxID=307580 RepID=A0AA95I5L5_9BACL|nr:serine protease [Paenibacillus woosongensis]WHX47207.1 serine protease [Paenibacillus woosongensis]